MNRSLLTVLPFFVAGVFSTFGGLATCIVSAQEVGHRAVWPPEHMRGLPAEFMQRSRDSLEAVASKMERVKFDSSVSRDSITWVRFGLASLLLGQRVEEINRFFESDKFVWLANPKFGFSLFSTEYFRLYGLLNHRTGTMKGPLSPKSQENFEKQMWIVAKANSKLAEIKADVGEMEGSENHHLSSKASDLLAAQFLRTIPAFANEKYDDGSSLPEQYEARLAYFLKWFDERAKRGLFVEAASPSYEADTINVLFNLRDFADDPVLRTKAEMLLDLTYANMAEEMLLTTRGGPKSRVKVGHEYDGGMSDRGYNLLFNAPGRAFDPIGDNVRPTSGYYPPPAIVNLARDTQRRGNYVFAKRWPGPLSEGRSDIPDEGGKRSLWRTLDRDKTVLRYGYATPDYVIGSAALDASWLDDASMGFRWQGIIFASDSLARIGFEVKPANDKDWHGFNPFFSVQDRNVLVTQKWVPVPPNPATANPSHLRVYFSPTLDEVSDEDGWVFVKDGGAYAAIKVVVGGFAWTPAWKHSDSLTKENKSFITLQSEDSPVITIVNQSADYDHDFVAFKKAIKAQPIELRDGTLRFATITFHGKAKPPQVRGVPVNLTPSKGYDSAFIRSDWESGIIHIRKGDATVTLDFSDPNKPTKIIGAPPTPSFPRGIGDDVPIILGKALR